MRDLLLNPVFPFLVAIAVFIFGLIFWRSGGEHAGQKRRVVFRGLGAFGLIAGVLMLVGAGISRFALNDALSNPPGQMVSVDGYDVHILCEGPKGAKTVIWIPGGYGPGWWMKRNHDDVKSTIRSCVYDHAGTGWSETGPFPRTIEREAAEVISLLDGAGETGPYVFAGHSWGGAMATNIAALHPEQTAGVVLLDPTTPLWQTFFAADGCRPADATPFTMFGVLFGLGHIDALNPLMSPYMQRERAALGEKTWAQLVALELRPSARLANRSSMDHACRNWTSYVSTPGALGDTPLLVITQTQTDEDHTSWLPADTTDFERKNHLARMAYADQQNLDFSSRSRLLKAPVGAGHSFPQTAPEFTREAVLDFVDSLP